MLLHITLKSGRDWYATFTDDELRAERATLERLAEVGMADAADLRMVDAELRGRVPFQPTTTEIHSSPAFPRQRASSEESRDV